MESIKLLMKQGIRRACAGMGGWRVGVVAAAMLVGGGAARAQNTGTIFGTVQDKTGAVVPGASVTVADTEHGVNRAVKTNGSGDFSLQSLPIGNYILTVGQPNFETAVVTDIKVDANTNTKEVVTLQPGSAGESITVQDTAGSAIDPNSATLATLLDPKLVEDLPIDGHNIVALTALLPGVVDVNAPTTFTGDTKGPTYSASGSRNTQNLMLFDGLMWNNLFYNTGINYPTPNALQEVSILLNNYKAEYGRNAGSVFNVLTKSGTNTFHGAVWDYLQNQYFNAADYLSHVNPKYNLNQFGATSQGPIIKDKLFYAGAYQQLIGRLSTTASDLTPGYPERGLMNDGVTPFPCNSAGPFAGMSCADFSKDVTTNVAGVQTLGKFLNPILVSGTSGNQATPQNVINVYTTAGEPNCVSASGIFQQAATYAAKNNYGATGKLQPTYLPFAQIPVQCLNPTMLSFLNKFVPVPGPTGFAVTSSPAPTGDKNGLIRVDYHLNGQNRFDVRYNIFTSNANAPLGVNSSSQGVATYALVSQHAKSHFANIGYQWIITPTLLNDLRFGYKRFESTQLPDDSRTFNNFCGSTPNCTNGNFIEPGIPTLPYINSSNSFFLGNTGQGYQDHINENVELAESLSWTKGNHNVKGGFNFLRLQYLTRADYPGSLSFSTTFTGVANADALTGLVDTVQAQNRLIQGGIQHNVFSYIQDDWRATAKLTLNLGIRYELPFQWFEPHGHAATFVPGLQSQIFPNAPGGLGFPGDPTVLSSLVPTDFNGIAPRFGFAYDTTGNGKFLIRGGYGIFFDAVNANVIGVGEPFHYQFLKTTPPGGATSPLLQADVNGNPLPGNPVQVIPVTYDPKNPAFIPPFSNFFPDRNFRTPYVMAVNFGFQFHVPHGGVLDTNYIGKFARKLTIPVDLNPTIYDCTGGYFQANPNTYCTGAASTATSRAARVRYQDFNYGGQGLVDIKSIGSSSYNALQMQYTQRGGKYLTILSSYTYSRSIDIQTNGQTTSNAVPNVFNVSSDRGLSDNNATHVFTLGWVVRYPRITGYDAFVRGALNNWVFGGQYQAHTGRPFSVTINNDTALVGEPNQRALILPGMNPLLPKNRHRIDKVNEYFNINAFSYPTIGTFGNQSRNSFIGPDYILTTMNLGRDVPLANIREGMRLNFRIEAFNVFNTPNLANPNAQFSCNTTSISTTAPGSSVGCTSVSGGAFGGLNTVTGLSNFGRVLTTYGNNANTSTNGRKMQLNMTVFY